MSDCQGTGSGWGTVEGVRLKILLLAAPDSSERAESVAQALTNHDPTVLRGPQGFFAAPLTAAKAARATTPHLVQAIGGKGLALAAGPVASGLGIPLVVSLRPEDVSKRSVKLANRANIVLLTSEAAVAPMRALGLNRDVYIIGDPEQPDDRAPFQGAIEVVYGRALEVAPEPTGEEVVPDEAPQLVQIGGLRKGP